MSTPGTAHNMTDDTDAVPSGFDEEREMLNSTQIDTIWVESRISATRVSISIERENGATGTSTASIEILNLLKYDADDDVFDESSGEIRYQELSDETQKRLDAQMDFAYHPDEYWD